MNNLNNLIFPSLIIFLLYTISKVLAKILHSRRDNEFKKIAEEFNLQISVTPTVLEERTSTFQVLKTLEVRKLFGNLNNKEVLIQDVIGKDGIGGIPFSFSRPFDPLYGPPEYFGRRSSSNRSTVIYVSNGIGTEKTKLNQESTYGYMSTKDIRKIITSL